MLKHAIQANAESAPRLTDDEITDIIYDVTSKRKIILEDDDEGWILGLARAIEERIHGGQA
jgi:hypothetical protein